MQKTTLAYLAGIVDGEGYVGIKRSQAYRCQGRQTPGYHARIQVRMVDEPAVAMLHKAFAGSLYREKPHCNNGRPLYCWCVSDAQAEKTCRALFPFLRVKRPQAKLIFRLRRAQANGKRHRTKVVGFHIMPHWTGCPVKIPNLRFSDAYVARLDAMWSDMRKLNGLARFQ